MDGTVSLELKKTATRCPTFYTNPQYLRLSPYRHSDLPILSQSTYTTKTSITELRLHTIISLSQPLDGNFYLRDTQRPNLYPKPY